MRVARAVTLAGRELRRRPTRSALTVLSVALAAALLTALLTIVRTAEMKVLDELAKGGPLSGIKVAAARPDTSQITRDDARPGAAAVLDQAAVDRIRALPSVRQVVPVTSTRVTVVAQAPKRNQAPMEPFMDTVVGVDINQVPTLPVTVLSGRLPAPGAIDEVVVNEGFLERFGYGRAEAATVVDSTVHLGSARTVRSADRTADVTRWTRARIVGVVAQEAGDGQILAPAELVIPARRWSTEPGSDRGPERPDPDAAARRTPYSGVFVVAEQIEDVGRVRAEISSVGYSTSAPENLIASVDRYLTVVEIILTSVGLIAAAVAALGITNAALAAVRERRREIGVLKAVGATDGDVLRLFLVECAALGVTGGVLGTAIGYLTALGVGQVVNRYLVEQGFAAVPVTAPIGILAAIIAGATGLAVVAGLVPAARAARLPAPEAMGSP